MVYMKMIDFLRSRVSIRHRFYLFVLCSALLCGGCNQQQASNVDTGTQNQILHLGNGTEPQDLDPQTVTGEPERNIILALFEGLISRNPSNLELVPAVAETWEASADQMTYTFHLRKGAKWSNGDPVTARDFVYTFNRMLHPLLANEYATNYYPILNAEKFNRGELTDFSQVGVKASDDYTLVFTMEREWPLFFEAISDIPPVHQDTIEKFGKISARGTEWTRPGNIVSNGPFVLDEWVPNKIIKVSRNRQYWDQGRVKLNGIYFYPIDNSTTDERMFRTGQLHMINGLPVEKIAEYQKEQPELIHIYPIYGTYYYLINTTRPPLNDIRVRKALAMSIDRNQIVTNVTKGGQIPAYSLNPPDPDGYHPLPGIEYNVENARQLLAEAGYPDGKDFPAFEIMYNTLEAHMQIAQAIQQMWLTSLNIKTTLVNQEWKVFLDTLSQKEFGIARMGSIAGIADPGDFLDSYTTSSGMNHTSWSNAEYDELVKQAISTSNRAKRFSLFQQAEAIFTDEVPLIPIYYYTKVRLMSPDLKGWKDNILDYNLYKDIYLSRE